MLTPNHYKVYDFIKSYIKSQHCAPTLQEIAEGIGLRAKSLISRYVHALAQAGLLELSPGKRQIRLVEQPSHEPQIPLLGCIAAGKPIEAIAEADAPDVIDMLTTSMRFKPFALKVKGDSMVDEGILDGDVILCEPANTAFNGDIVVALIDDQEATLKRLYHSKGSVMLVPANIALKPQRYEAHRIKVQGIFRGLVRMSR